MFWELAAASAIASIPSLITGGVQIQQTSKARKEERKLKAADITRSYYENLRTSQENLGLLFGSSMGREGGGNELGDIYRQKRREVESNLYEGSSRLLNAIGYSPGSVYGAINPVLAKKIPKETNTYERIRDSNRYI